MIPESSTYSKNGLGHATARDSQDKPRQHRNLNIDRARIGFLNECN